MPVPRLKHVAIAMLSMFMVLLISIALKAQPVIHLKGNVYESWYDTDKKQPILVKWTLTKEQVTCDNPKHRTGLDFKADKRVKPNTNFGRDYAHTVYDKGHLCPAADRECNGNWMDSTFLYTNCCLQRDKLNRNGWEYLERYTRAAAAIDGKVTVYAGGVFVGSWKRIGADSLLLPVGFYKVIKRATGAYEIYYYDNAPCMDKPETHQITKDSLEKKVSHTVFFLIFN